MRGLGADFAIAVTRPLKSRHIGQGAYLITLTGVVCGADFYAPFDSGNFDASVSHVDFCAFGGCPDRLLESPPQDADGAYESVHADAIAVCVLPSACLCGPCPGSVVEARLDPKAYVETLGGRVRMIGRPFGVAVCCLRVLDRLPVRECPELQENVCGRRTCGEYGTPRWTQTAAQTPL